MLCHGGPHGEAPGLFRNTGKGANLCARIFNVVFIGGNRQGRVSCLGMVSLNNFSRLWSIETVPSHLVPGSGVIRSGGEGHQV